MRLALIAANKAAPTSLPLWATECDRPTEETYDSALSYIYGERKSKAAYTDYKNFDFWSIRDNSDLIMEVGRQAFTRGIRFLNTTFIKTVKYLKGFNRQDFLSKYEDAVKDLVLDEFEFMTQDPFEPKMKHRIRWEFADKMSEYVFNGIEQNWNWFMVALAREHGKMGRKNSVQAKDLIPYFGLSKAQQAKKLGVSTATIARMRAFLKHTVAEFLRVRNLMSDGDIAKLDMSGSYEGFLRALVDLNVEKKDFVEYLDSYYQLGYLLDRVKWGHQ